MKRVVLPGTDLAMSRLAFGTGRLHHLPSSRRRVDLLAAALDHGLTHFDTAPYYGLGLSESDLGRAFVKKRGEVTIATKFGLYPPGGAVTGTPSLWLRKGLGKLSPRFSRPTYDWSVARAAESLHASLSRLRSDYVDILFLHDPSGGEIRSDELWRWLEGEKRKGTLRAWGISGQPSVLRASISHPLSMVLQVRDSTVHAEADAIVEAGRPLQLTYGYFSASSPGGPSFASVLKGALLRNTTGSIVVSSRTPAHVAEQATLVG